MMQEIAPLSQLLRTKNTVLSFRELALLWGGASEGSIKMRIHRYIKSGELVPLRRGFYAKDKNYNPFELAVKIYTPSYISLETVLLSEGVTFQYYESTFAVSYLTREISCDGKNYLYKKVKNSVLLNTLGIINRETYFIASKERAFLDAIYLYGNYHFDNLRSIDWGKCFEIVKIYRSKEMKKRLESYYKDEKENA